MHTRNRVQIQPKDFCVQRARARLADYQSERRLRSPETQSHIEHTFMIKSRHQKIHAPRVASHRHENMRPPTRSPEIDYPH